MQIFTIQSADDANLPNFQDISSTENGHRCHGDRSSFSSANVTLQTASGNDKFHTKIRWLRAFCLGRRIDLFKSDDHLRLLNFPKKFKFIPGVV